MDNDIRKYRIYKFLSVGISFLLTLSGSVLIIFLIKLLNVCLGINIIYCLILSILLPQIYSIVINVFLLDKIDIMLDEKLFEKEEVINEIDNVKDNTVSLINERFNGLSRENKLNILRMIRNDLSVMSIFGRMHFIDDMDKISLEDNESEIEVDKSYVKKKILEEEVLRRKNR